jgi:hypothetical protein
VLKDFSHSKRQNRSAPNPLQHRNLQERARLQIDSAWQLLLAPPSKDASVTKAPERLRRTLTASPSTSSADASASTRKSIGAVGRNDL